MLRREQIPGLDVRDREQFARLEVEQMATEPPSSEHELEELNVVSEVAGVVNVGVWHTDKIEGRAVSSRATCQD